MQPTPCLRFADRACARAFATRSISPGRYIDIDAEYDILYRNTGRKAFLVKPDHYVFGSVRTVEDLPALLDELAESLKQHGWNNAA